MAAAWTAELSRYLDGRKGVCGVRGGPCLRVPILAVPLSPAWERLAGAQAGRTVPEPGGSSPVPVEYIALQIIFAPSRLNNAKGDLSNG